MKVVVVFAVVCVFALVLPQTLGENEDTAAHVFKRSRTTFIIFTPKGKHNTNNAEITINGNKLEQVKLKDILGVKRYEYLSRIIHVNNLYKGIARHVEMLNKLKHFLTM